MQNQVTRQSDHIETTSALYFALELGLRQWKVAFHDGSHRQPRLVQISASDFQALSSAIDKAVKRFGLSDEVRLKSCYEAGREGFWLHRALEDVGIENRIVDSASIETSRRRRRAKTDRLDAAKLVTQLIRHDGGEKRVWSVLHVPEEHDEDLRHVQREIAVLKKERRQHVNRLKGLLFAVGIELPIGPVFARKLDLARQWNGKPVARHLRIRLLREYDRIRLVDEQIKALQKEREELLASSEAPAVQAVKKLMSLKAIGAESAWVFATEFFGWRRFRNRRQVAGAAGLTPTPYASGDEQRELGISKAGNKRVRYMAIEIAWCWLRFQPDSKLSTWFQERYASGSRRFRRIGIVAVARKLLVDLWRYVDFDIVPEGAATKI